MFARKRADDGRAMIFYVTAGYPDFESTEDVVLALDEAGTDLVELGIPFSDPIADGPTIQESSHAALEAGTTVRGVFDLARRLREKTEMPLLLFTAFNPVLRFGLEAFADEAVRSGCDGILVPDLPPEEASGLMELCSARDLKMSFLTAPTTSPERLEFIARQSTGFVYYVSLRGVTGARERMPDDLQSKLEAMKAASEIPVCVGFGISTPEHARLAGAVADGVVVGSALVSLIAKHAGSQELKQEVRSYARSMIDALKSI